MNKNLKKRAEIINELVESNYQVGRQDRCKLWVYRNIVNKQYPMHERTFWRYLNYINERERKEFDRRQTSLDFGDF